ncbi:HPr family phosphocarrier protein [Niallia nealsonii]|uniref:HPr family phosphocarrier protein n=1 Tax=Niallia nealsonii TaxID=115979 RepID=A0A2N0YZF3_9BACI|nr:HPr family phosphocarrier protein [Niallia nealsonii]PKG22629.1 HPr family phosphocarrier protein [Niallia nealsonii]
MVVKKLVVKIPRGLQPATHAAIFVQKIYSFNSKVMIIKDGRIVCGGKNVMVSSQLTVKVMGLAIEVGDEITLIVSGIDEHPTFIALEKFLLNKDHSFLPFVVEQTKPIDN